jgi:hypothetical protein
MSVSIAGGAAMLGCLVLLVLLSFLPASAGHAGDKRAGDVPALPATRRPVGLPPLAFELGWQRIILLFWAATPLLLGYAVSFAGRPILLDRYMIVSQPALLILAARGLRVLCFSRLVLAGAFVALFSCSIPVLYEKLTKTWREDFRSAVADFAAHFRGSDEVVFAQHGLPNAIAYYMRAPIEHQATISNPDTDPVDWPGTDRAWFFVRDSVAWRSGSILNRIEVLYFPEQAFHYRGVTVYLYVRRLPTP